MKRASIVVGVLLAITVAGLCVGGVQRTHEAAARTQCINKLKVLGLGIYGYHDVHKHFPHAVSLLPTKDFPAERQLSWFVRVSHYMISMMDEKWHYDPKVPFGHPVNRYVVQHPYPLWFLTCPMDPRIDEFSRSTSYVGVTGVGNDAAWLPLDHPDAGIFGYDRKTKLSDLEAKGAANVMMVSETATDNGHWARGGHATARGLDIDGAAYLGEQGQFSSFHDGRFLFSRTFTTNLLLADGTVRGFTDDTSDRVFEAMATLRDN